MASQPQGWDARKLDSGAAPGGAAPSAPPPSRAASPAAAAPRRLIHEVRFVSYPSLLYIWPIIAMGFLFYPLAWEGALPTLGWVYLLGCAFVLLALGVDVDRNQAAFWVVVLLLIWVGGMLLKEYQFSILGDLYNFFASLGVKYDKHFGLAFSIVLSIPFAIMLVWARFNDRWRITHNEFEHYSLGRMDDSLGRGAKTIRTSYPCVLESILGLAGTLIVYNASGTQELRRIPNVMFLPFIRKRLNVVLESVAVTTEGAGKIEDDEG